ncbi:protein of unknown function [Pararobbsia alpina]|uniref:MarR family winged helix-turn-helix transcriptional regulator n=1 Tax=Pararobbsia alpina TaxID=621374 RepID=UPI0039A687C3
MTTDVQASAHDTQDQQRDDDALMEDENYELALRRAARFMSQQYALKLDPIGLTPPQFTILRKIERRDGLTMAELVDVIVADRSTLVRAVQLLRKDGLVTSTLGPPPGRRNVLSLTPLGAERIAQARKIWRDAQQEFEARFGVERARMLRMELFEVTGHKPASHPFFSDPL